MPGERYGSASSVVPVRHDVHRTCGATLLADEAPADHRPWLVLRKGIQSDVDHAVTALTARTLNVARHVAVGDPFRRRAERPTVR
jgi:hypothetical protein